MKVAERIFSRDQWLNLLNDFSDLVADKKYTKINYDDWRILSKPVSTNVVLELSSGLIGIPIIFIQSGAHTLISVEATDGSLGDFLFENVFNKEEQAMAYGNANFTCGTVSATTLTNTSTITGDSINTTKTYQLNIDGTTWNNTCTTDSIGIVDRTDELADKINQRPTFNDVNEMINNKMKEKENVNMKGFNFDFGPCTGDQVRLSMYGLAVKNQSGVYVSYNPKTKEIVDVDILNFDGAKYMYKIPVALKDVALGDIIIHNRKPMFVVALSTDGNNTLTCVDVYAGEQKAIIPTTNMFGYSFITKVVSLFNTIGTNAPSPDAPFGNMLPLMLMDDGNDEKFNPMMLMMMMNQSGNQMFSNPLMMMLMFSENEPKDKDLMKMMVLAQMMNQNSNT